MLSPRWRKVLADITSNKTRTLLVVLSIAVGVFAVGVIAASREILSKSLANATKTENITITALPPDTRLFQPQLIAGRWLLPEDENAIVIAADLLKTERDLKLGDDLVLDLNRHKSRWQIVGIAQVLFADRAAYTSYDYATRVTGEVDQSSYMTVVTDQHDAVYQAEVAKALRAALKRAGFDVSGTQTIVRDVLTYE